MSGYLGLRSDQFEMVHGWFQDTVASSAAKDRSYRGASSRRRLVRVHEGLP